MTMRRSLGLVAVAALYVVAALFSFRAGLLPGRPLYEGFAPPAAYRWVKPPPEVAKGNLEPLPANGTLRFAGKNSPPFNLNTPDGQAALILPPGAVDVPAGEGSLTLTMTPLDAQTLAPAPKGMTYDGNAYRITAAYSSTGEPARFLATSCPSGEQVNTCLTVVLRYALGAKGIYRLDADAWKPLTSTVTASALQVFADVDGIGTFVALRHGQPRKQRGDLLALILGLSTAVVATIVTRTVIARRKAPVQKKGAQKKGASKNKR